METQSERQISPESSEGSSPKKKQTANSASGTGNHSEGLAPEKNAQNPSLTRRDPAPAPAKPVIKPNVKTPTSGKPPVSNPSQSSPQTQGLKTNLSPKKTVTPPPPPIPRDPSKGSPNKQKPFPPARWDSITPSMILNPMLGTLNWSAYSATAGGKANHLAQLTQMGFSVPPWFCLSSNAFDLFIKANRLEEKLKIPLGLMKDLRVAPEGVFKAGTKAQLKNGARTAGSLQEFAAQIEFWFINSHLPAEVEANLLAALDHFALREEFVAVRSSGLDEDSAENSFAGQFSSYLYQKGKEAVFESIKRCWASGFSERALSYRMERGLTLDGIRVGVVIQKMVHAECAGVLFSRNPIRPLDRDHLILSSVWGLGEGLVSGELDADHFKVHRKTLAITSSPVPKTHLFLRNPKGGLSKSEVPADLQNVPSLTERQVTELARIGVELEEKLHGPQDIEWAVEKNQIYLVQTRPITNLPPEPFFDSKINGEACILWDNSNIIESYSGVTSPLTFSFASSAYRQVYIQFCQLVGVPQTAIEQNEPMFRNMLGLVRGRIYYNLINWYKLVLMLPGTSKNQGFMETMMGVRQKLSPELSKVFDEIAAPAEYSLPKRILLHSQTLFRYLKINKIIGDFRSHFGDVYERTRKLPFESLSLTELSRVYQQLDEQILRKWQAPIINDYLCMVFFGVLKNLTEKWIEKGDSGASLQNDLLCGQGDLESTEPTKMLMRIAAEIDQGDAGFRNWFITSTPEQVWEAFERVKMTTAQNSAENAQAHSPARPPQRALHPDPAAEFPEVGRKFAEFLDRYGFRCINELKLEEPDLHDNPTFVLEAVAGYVRMNSYSISVMEEREKQIRFNAEKKIKEKLFGWKRWVYFFVVREARKAVRNRENLRFARTKIFGVARHLFRGMGTALTKLHLLDHPRDIFYLTTDEILGFIEGRSISLDLKGLVHLRKDQYAVFRKDVPPPDRLITQGAAAVSFLYPQVLLDADLMRDENQAAPKDPRILMGTPCCPGVIEGTVRVVHQLEDARGLAGEILVTGRTDPGWVPLYPSCSGLLIERGSLLSHSAVVARELGLPTIVGITGGLMTRLKTGQRVRIDAGKGEVRILD